ncbi:MAG TPA: hypothetical protein VKC61_00955 [Pyrinomonadaceae bacterium]|nr:hypothetical protein [Pyrinomonadaceae bacterium]
MPGKLYIIANATGVGLNFANTESPGDDLTVDKLTIAYSGGKDGDYCLIPTCESPGDFDAHHMSVAGIDSSFNICFWKNNSQGNIVYYSTNGQFTPSNSMPGADTDTYDQAALLVYPNGSAVSVQMSNVTDH